MPQYLFRPRETLILNYYWLSYISIFRTAHKYVDDTPHICRGYTLSPLSPLSLSLIVNYNDYNTNEENNAKAE